MDKRDADILAQHINALDESVEQLEQMYLRKNVEGFNKVRKFILEVSGRIEQILK